MTAVSAGVVLAGVLEAGAYWNTAGNGCLVVLVTFGSGFDGAARPEITGCVCTTGVGVDGFVFGWIWVSVGVGGCGFVVVDSFDVRDR